MEDVYHDVLQLRVNLFEGPAQALRILGHLQSGGGNAACVGCLARAEQDAALLEIRRCVQGGRHVCALGHSEAAVCDQHLRVLQIQLVLGRAGEGDIALGAPYALALMIDAVGAGFRILGQAGTLYLLYFDQCGNVNAVRVVNPAGGVAAGDGLCAQLPCLLNGIGRDIAGAGNGDDLALQALAVAAEHLVREVQQAVAGSLSAGEASAVGQAFAGKHAFVQVTQALILAEKIADFAAAHADITGGNIGICTDIFIELCHEALAECHHLAVRLPLGVKVRAALCAADGQAGEGILEGLLKAKEFENAQVDGGVETEAALVWANGAVELDAVAVVYLHLSLIIHPGNAEHDDSLRCRQSLQKRTLAVCVLVLLDYDGQRIHNLRHSLDKLRLIRILLLDALQYFTHITHGSSTPLYFIIP